MAENVLHATPLFQGIPKGDLALMLSCLSATRREFPRSATIVEEGDLVPNIAILLSGTARSLKTDSAGKQVIVTLIKPGGYIGILLAASHGRASPVTVQALENLAVLFIPMQNILTRCDCPHHTKLLSNLLDAVAEKALLLHDRNDCLIRPTIRDKVLTFLLEFAHKAGSHSFTIPMGRDAMAGYLDVDRSALSRELSWMKRDGLIDYKRNWFNLRI
ncbi:hypothetical protein SDC9_116826 [bioreactor metagenome]|uniref:Cyclic nucleotide-binding domain-containing protein n=1 Tax=bioreactor metagenome TaxID=1076179 RepID=A0A645BXP5_9ZZZZ|nr:Crp/Fnr family transcriptional regulator [Candidatus Pelethousia sp.]